MFPDLHTLTQHSRRITILKQNHNTHVESQHILPVSEILAVFHHASTVTTVTLKVTACTHTATALSQNGPLLSHSVTALMTSVAGLTYIIVVLMTTVNALKCRIKTLTNTLTGVFHAVRTLSFSALTNMV